MGLDIVELVMEIEEEFGLRIADSDAEQLTTVGRLHAYLLDKIGHVPQDGCPTSHVFYRLRRALMRELHIPRRRIAPTTRVDCLLPIEDRQLFWNRLAQRLGSWSIPPLECPESFLMAMRLARGSIGVAGLALILAVALYPPLGLWTLGLCLYTTVIAALLIWISPRYATEIPGDCRSVRLWVESLVRRNYFLLKAPRGTYPPDKVWDRLCSLIGKNLGVDPQKLTPNTRFVEDLGVD